MTIYQQPMGLPSALLEVSRPQNQLKLNGDICGKILMVRSAAEALLQKMGEAEQTFHHPRAVIHDGIQAVESLMSITALQMPALDADTAVKCLVRDFAREATPVLSYQEPSLKPLAVVAIMVVVATAAVFTAFHLLFGNMVGIGLTWLIASVIVFKGIIGRQNHADIIRQAHQLIARADELQNARWA